MLKLELEFESTYIIAIVILASLLGLFAFIDVHYVCRQCFTILYGMYCEESISLLDISTIYGICTLNDLDFTLRHMNSSRFLREMDFARIFFYIKTGIKKNVKDLGGDILQSATSIQYRRTIPFLTTYKIKTTMLYWDENAFYLEHEFISLKDGFVSATVLSQQKLINITIQEILQRVTKNDMPRIPTPPEDLLCWINAMKHSSERLQKKY